MNNQAEIKKINLISALLFGMFTVSIHFTELKSDTGFVGVLEICLFLIAIFIIIDNLIIQNNHISILFYLPALYLAFITLPITLVNLGLNFFGSSLTTAIALIFASLIAISFSFLTKREMYFFGVGMSIMLLFSFVGVIISGDIFTQIARYAFLADNPNQLAAYSIASSFLLSVLLPKGRFTVFMIITSLLYGSITLSDSLYLSIVIAASLIIFFKFYQIPTLIIFISLLLVLFLILILINVQELGVFEYLRDVWYSADEGGARLTLALNGIKAYLSSPFLGHGGGAFSGASVPFSRFESHNTFIDLLTIAGPFIAVLFYAPLFFAAYSLFKQERFSSAALLVGVIAYSLFHFIGRHPIMWVIWALSIKISLEYRKKCVEY